MSEHDAHPLVVRRSRDVMHETQACVIGVVDIVDGEQQTIRRRCQPHQLGRGNEQALVRTLTGPRDLCSGKRTVDLFSMMVGQAIEQRRMTPAHVGERFDDRRVRPCALDGRRGSVSDTKAQLPRARRDRGKKR